MHKITIIKLTAACVLILAGFFSIFAHTQNQIDRKVPSDMERNKPGVQRQSVHVDPLIRSLPREKQKALRGVGSLMAHQLVEKHRQNKGNASWHDEATKIIITGMHETALIVKEVDEQELLRYTQAAIGSGFESISIKVATRVETNNYVKNVLREEILRLREILAEWTNPAAVMAITYRSCVPLTDGTYEIVEKTKVMNTDQVEMLIEEMENQLNSLNQMSEYDRLQLVMAQKEQAELELMLEDILRNWSSTQKEIIKNLR